MNLAKEKIARCYSDSSMISNAFAYSFSLQSLLEMITSAQQALNATNQTIDRLFFKSTLATLSLTKEEFLRRIWYKRGRRVDREKLYAMYGEQETFPVRAGMKRRNEVIGHLNMMSVGLCQKLKESVFNNVLYYSTEEDLFNALLRVFHPKLFESPVFRKVASSLILRSAARCGR